MPERDDNFELIDDMAEVYEDAMALKDEIGYKKTNVYLLTSTTTETIDPNTNQSTSKTTHVWEQILPTPIVANLGLERQMMDGGELEQGSLVISQVPVSKYTETQLKTANTQEVDGATIEKYYVIDEKAYTANYIERKYLHWTINLVRAKAKNVGDLIPFEKPVPTSSP